MSTNSDNNSNWPWEDHVPEFDETMNDGSSWPRISIVTPSYNQGHFLERTIRSVLFQGYPNLEYIVIDGGSTDDSVKIIKKYDPWLTYWVSEKDEGQSQAINKGFEFATGEIFAWLNSDDIYSPGALYTVGTHLARRQRALLIGSSSKLSGMDISNVVLDARKPSWYEMVYDTRSFPQPSVFWTRDLWQLAGPLRKELYFVMDYYLWLCMRPKAFAEIFVDDVLSIAQIHADQKWKKAERDGTLHSFTRERASVVLRAVNDRGENPYAWYLRAWLFRLHLAWKMKNPLLIINAPFLKEAFIQILSGNITS